MASTHLLLKRLIFHPDEHHVCIQCVPQLVGKLLLVEDQTVQ
jgi:hypothetical protein